MSREIIKNPLGFRFAVTFFIGGILPNLLDLRFKRVSGLAVKAGTSTINEGGQNLYSHRVPDRVEYGTLTLERGFVVGSLLNIELNDILSTAEFPTSNVLVTLLNENKLPLAGWLFIKTFPVRWETSDLDASQEEVVIDTIELSYSSMQVLRI
ncbi:phage tail protein [Pseudenhygromyxa sp. WMMC2535]|uniref:phage tail protein n=1 Tax=Pseudenhygromyxa sp. WMMC2535 TaxID=2712867 RepID=UPI00155271B7|nr:phage tail protein [Pseudenhygromyxa sp. WMMC2535]NVB43283.1 phage tail protein [Pseudenhygromyxa sp. WMMC2535]